MAVLDTKTRKIVNSLFDKAVASKIDGNVSFEIKLKDVSSSVLISLINEEHSLKYISMKQIRNGVVMSEMRFARKSPNNYIAPYYLMAENGTEIIGQMFVSPNDDEGIRILSNLVSYANGWVPKVCR